MKHILIVTALALTACAMSPEELALENKKLDLLAKVASQPTLTCTTGCTYTDPKRNLALFPKETNGWDFANQVLKTGVAIAPWAAVTKIAVDGLVASGNNTTNNDSYNQSGGNTDTGAVDNSVTSGDVIDSNDDNSTTDSNDDNSTTDSNDNNSTVDSNDDNSVDENSTAIVEPEPEPAILE